MPSQKKSPATWAESPKDHLADFRDLLLWMAEEGHDAWKNEENGLHKPSLRDAVNRYIKRAWRRLDLLELEKGLRDGEFDPARIRGSIACLILKPEPRTGMIPVLVPKFIFARNNTNRYPEVRLRVALFYESKADRENISGVRVLGYRFEPPEGPGRHNYTHFQYIIGFGDKDDRFYELEQDLPCHAPAWPICANDPATMLSALYVGLYGAHGLPSDRVANRILTDFINERTFCTPKVVWYKFKDCPSFRSKYIETWERQVGYIQGHLRQKPTAKRAMLERLSDKPTDADDQANYQMFWTEDNLP